MSLPCSRHSLVNEQIRSSDYLKMASSPTQIPPVLQKVHSEQNEILCKTEGLSIYDFQLNTNNYYNLNFTIFNQIKLRLKMIISLFLP